MAKEFKLQDPGEGIHEVEIQEVLVSAGDHVQEGQAVLVVESDKAAVEIPSPHTGVVEDIKAETGNIVRVGDVLMTFGDAEAEERHERRVERKPEGEAEEDAAEEANPLPEEEKEQEAPEREEEAEPDDAAERIEETAARDKEDRGPVPASPAIRRLARELDVDLRQVRPSGPGGRVTVEDVRRSAKSEAEAQGPAREAPTPLPDFGRWGTVERVPLRSIRRATAKRMALAWSQIPHVTHQDLADITELEEFRRRHQDQVEAAGGKLTITTFLMKAAVSALKQFPRFNSSLDCGSHEIVLKRYYHLGIAIDTERGLVVPVVRDVDRKSITELAVELRELAEKARDGNITKDHTLGGTFTITNVGPLGGTGFMPIINHPEAAILGLARVRLEPTVRGTLDNFEIVPRMMLPLCLGFDHRLNDGADAARFMRAIVDILADPEEFVLMI